MIWGGAKTRQDMQDRLDRIVVPQIQNGACQRVLCFNEPDKKEQSHMTVDRVMEFWPLLQALDVPLCSPACANPVGHGRGFVPRRLWELDEGLYAQNTSV